MVRPITSAETIISGSGHADRLGHGVDVAHDPGHQVAGAGPLDVGEGEGEGRVDDVLAQAGQEALAQGARHRQPEPGEDALGEGGGGQGEHRAVEVAGRPAVDDDVDEGAEQPGDGQRGHGRAQQDDGGGHDEAAVPAPGDAERGPGLRRRGDGQDAARGCGVGGPDGAGGGDRFLGRRGGGGGGRRGHASTAVR